MRAYGKGNSCSSAPRAYSEMCHLCAVAPFTAQHHDPTLTNISSLVMRCGGTSRRREGSVCYVLTSGGPSWAGTEAPCRPYADIHGERWGTSYPRFEQSARSPTVPKNSYFTVSHKPTHNYAPPRCLRARFDQIAGPSITSERDPDDRSLTKGP